MAPSQPFDTLRPDQQNEIRKSRAAGGDYTLPINSTLELTNAGPRLALFQKSHRLDVGPEQMVCLSIHDVFIAFVTMQASMYGLTVQFGRMPIPGMTADGQPLAPGDPNAPPA
jgi:hypothetical protein